MSSTYTNTHTYTKPRIEVVRDQFELFLRYTGMASTDRDRLLASITRGELAAIGAYLERDGYRFMEVELEIDWELHAQLKRAEGDMFDTDQAGWEENASPEVNQYARQLSRIAKKEGLPVRHWIQVAREIRSDPTKHQALCGSLGYSFGSSVAPWRGGSPREKEISVLDLPETKIYERQA
jgi:hypothetical protein